MFRYIRCISSQTRWRQQWWTSLKRIPPTYLWALSSLLRLSNLRGSGAWAVLITAREDPFFLGPLCFVLPSFISAVAPSPSPPPWPPLPFTSPSSPPHGSPPSLAVAGRAHHPHQLGPEGKWTALPGGRTNGLLWIFQQGLSLRIRHWRALHWHCDLLINYLFFLVLIKKYKPPPLTPWQPEPQFLGISHISNTLLKRFPALHLV